MNYMHTAEQIVGGVLEIVKTCHEKQPQAEILVMVCGSWSLIIINNFIVAPEINMHLIVSFTDTLLNKIVEKYNI